MNTKPALFIVVDDDAINNMLCKFSIKKYFGSIPIVTFVQPETALAVIKNEYSPESRPTVLFLDINMPTMKGWDFLKTFATFDAVIREQFTIYILSSSFLESDEEKAAAHPLVSGFIRKPLMEASLKKIFDGMEVRIGNNGNSSAGSSPFL